MSEQCRAMDPAAAAAPEEVTGSQPNTPTGHPPRNASSHGSASNSPPGIPPDQTPAQHRSTPCPVPAPGPAQLLPEPLRHSGPRPPHSRAQGPAAPGSEPAPLPGTHPRTLHPAVIQPGPKAMRKTRSHPGSGPARPHRLRTHLRHGRARAAAEVGGGRGEGGERDPDVAAAADWLRLHEGGGSGGGAAGSEVRGQGAGLRGARAEPGPGTSRTAFRVQGPNPETRRELRAPAGRSGQNLSLNHSAVIKAGPGLRLGRYRGVGSALGSISAFQTHRGCWEAAPGCRASPGSL